METTTMPTTDTATTHVCEFTNSTTGDGKACGQRATWRSFVDLELPSRRRWLRYLCEYHTDGCESVFDDDVHSPWPCIGSLPC